MGSKTNTFNWERQTQSKTKNVCQKYSYWYKRKMKAHTLSKFMLKTNEKIWKIKIRQIVPRQNKKKASNRTRRAVISLVFFRSF